MAGSELIWKLKGYSPETIPMARLAEYMKQLASLFGGEADVHFVRVEKGSVGIVSRIRGGGNASRIERRIDAVRRGQGPQDATRAYRTIDAMVAEDGGPARLMRGSATIIRFSGKRDEVPEVARITEVGFLVGKLYALAETPKAEVSARIRPSDGSNAVICTASADMGRKLRDALFEAVRVHGQGTWTRSQSGTWTCTAMNIEDVRIVQNLTLRQAINELRALEVEWPDDPIAEMATLNDLGGVA